MAERWDSGLLVVVTGTLVGLAIAGLVAWWFPLAAFAAWAVVDGVAIRLRQRSTCDRCGRVQERALEEYQGERMCRLCRSRAESDARLDDLVERATATAMDLNVMDADWPNQQETEEIEIRLRALGPDVEIAWREYLRPAGASSEAGTTEAREHRAQVKQKLLDLIESAREMR